MEESTLIMPNLNRNKENKVTVIIATTAEMKRKKQIDRAIESVLTQKNCEFNLLIIINGTRFDSEVRSTIEKNKEVTCHYLTEGNFPKSLLYARKLVDTEYFCFLDDDDELLSLSLANRLAAFSDNPNADVVIGNGLMRQATGTELEKHPEISTYQQGPLKALTRKNGNWLASCAGMFRTATIPNEYFSDYAAYAEWTYFAFKLAIYKNIVFIEPLCYRINVNAESLSHNEAYLFGQYAMTGKVLALPLPRWSRASVIIKRRNIEHEFAEKYLSESQTSSAWLYHLKSLSNRTTFVKYFLFTRYLLISLVSK